MRGATSTLVRVLTGAAVLVTTAFVPVAAQEAAPTTVPAVDPVQAPTSTTLADPPPAAVTPEAATVTVDDEASYRAALASLSTAPSGPNTIEVTADIVVDDGTDPTYTGDADLVIDGDGHTLDGAGVNRLLVVESADAELALVDLTVRGGRSTGDGGAVLASGGAQVEFEGVTFSFNEAGGDGGALAATGQVTGTASTFEGNVAGGDGGALRVDSLNALGTSTLVGNRARRGGAVAFTDVMNALNITVTGNVASERGGGLYADDPVQSFLIYATIAENAAPVAANVDLAAPQGSLLATVLADPAGGGANCDPADPVHGSASFSDDASCGSTGWTGTEGADALLGPLQDNGGPTETRAPLPESPLVDVIDPLAFWGGPTLGCTTYDDQRGITRPQDGNGRPEIGGRTYGPYGPAGVWCDIGAVEREAPPAPPTPVPMAPRFTG